MNYFSSNLLIWVTAALITAQYILCMSHKKQHMLGERDVDRFVPKVTCSNRRIRAVFGPLVQSNLRVDNAGEDAVRNVEHCGAWKRDKRTSSEPRSFGGPHEHHTNTLTFYSKYDSCYTLVDMEGSRVVVPLLVQLTGDDRWFSVKISCPWPNVTTLLPRHCDTQRDLRVDCGHQNVSIDICLGKLGCCYDDQDSTCYYKRNACSLDSHLVFSVKTAVGEFPFGPRSLVVKNQPHAHRSPAVTTADTAVFKIGVMDCGVKMEVVGDVVRYEVEVETVGLTKTVVGDVVRYEVEVETVSQHPPFRLQVQCEDEASLYFATNPPPVTAMGTFGVQMRIATDVSFTSFFPDDQLPVSFPLREVIYVEISIAPPFLEDTVSLRVRDCFAYPASRQSVWTLLYDGCPNAVEDMISSIPKDGHGNSTSNSQVRQFYVKTFAFVDPHTGHPSLEEIYFYCWVEICTEDVECAQPCTITSSEHERRRREASSGSREAHLVSLGPLRMDQNSTGRPEENQCVVQEIVFLSTVGALSAASAALLLFLLTVVLMRMRKPAAVPVNGRLVKNEETPCETPCEEMPPSIGPCQ